MSTNSGQLESIGFYIVEQILAEHRSVWNNGPGQPSFHGIKYLTKWDGYPLHE